MKAYEIKPKCWTFKLAPQLTGKAQQAYAALEADAASDYTGVAEDPKKWGCSIYA